MSDISNKWQPSPSLLARLGFGYPYCHYHLASPDGSQVWPWPVTGENKGILVLYAEPGPTWVVFQPAYPGPHREAVRWDGFHDEADFLAALYALGFPKIREPKHPGLRENRSPKSRSFRKLKADLSRHGSPAFDFMQNVEEAQLLPHPLSPEFDSYKHGLLAPPRTVYRKRP